MARYIAKRLLWIIPVVMGVAVFVFTLMYFTPGDPVDIILGSEATPDQVAAMRAKFGLDKGYFGQLVDYLEKTFLHFDLGVSYQTQQSVSAQVFQRLPYTLRVGLITMLLAILMGIPLGIVAATNQNTWKDNASIVASLFFVSMPNFWFALLMVALFAVRLGWLPAVGIETWKGYIMPCIAMSVGTAASIARQTRSSMLEVIRQDYITTARAKGQKEVWVIYRHALKNALIPVITVIGHNMALTLGGAIIAETIFSIPGLGTYMLNAVNFRDYPAIRGAVLMISVCFCFIILGVDIVYAIVDPRIRAQYKGGN